MKVVAIPLTEPEESNVFNPIFAFKAEWCLDLHGFLNRDQFKTRLDEINTHIEPYPLMPERMKNVLYWLVGACASLIALIATFVGISKWSSSSFVVGAVFEVVLAVATLVAKYVIELNAKNRAAAFERALNPKLKEYNRTENPTVNWKFTWRPVLDHFDINTTVGVDLQGQTPALKIRGKATPKYLEHAEIVLEIHDALAYLTANTVTVNLTPLNVPTFTAMQPVYPSPQVIVNDAKES
jgi:hypothetical protein